MKQIFTVSWDVLFTDGFVPLKEENKNEKEKKEVLEEKKKKKHKEWKEKRMKK